jgi:hypothetical protein
MNGWSNPDVSGWGQAAECSRSSRCAPERGRRWAAIYTRVLLRRLLHRLLLLPCAASDQARGEQGPRRHAPTPTPTPTHRRVQSRPGAPPPTAARSLSPASIGSLSARRRPPTRDHMGLLAVQRAGNRRGGTRRPAPGRGPSPLCTLVNGRQAASHPLQPPSASALDVVHAACAHRPPWPNRR